MLVFVIPVKCKTIEKNWASFSRLLDRCIGSICNQSNTNFKVVVACHEIPETTYNNDPRVTFLQVDFAPPGINTPLIPKEKDKGKKIKLATDYAKKLGASYIMVVDSDDCISNKICEFVNKNRDDSKSGWYVKKGYLYPEGKKYAYLNLKNFQTICGTCAIIKPEHIDLMYGENFWFHHDRTKFSNIASLEPLPFPAALYSMLNGSNIYLDVGEMKKRTEVKPSKKVFFKTLFRRLGKYRLMPTALIKKEFNLKEI
ncbi:hypothetical protein [Psychroserpens luteus]|uniref:Glycosyl transferase family 2 n=1 Tax=Psychroserpens luteus TaxID=1434066 RepID=A0ABW6A135_9FLAO|nr:hypothetical protein [Psychroserpens luteus]